jgi:hypothetical protein
MNGDRVLLVVLLALLLGGCSMLRVGYGQFDTLAGWMAQDYFELEPAQREAFARRFERLHQWHRREQLPDYARFFGELRDRVHKGARAEDVQWAVDGIKARFATLAARAAPDAAELLADLTPAQIEALRNRLDRDNRKFVREHRLDQPPAARKLAQQRRLLSQIRDWVGPLSADQETRIIALIQPLPLSENLRHDDRLRRQKEFFALLEQRGHRALFAPRLREWLVNWESGRSPELARAFDEAWRKRAEFYAAVDRLLTPEQRAHLTGRLQDYIEDFRELAARGGGNSSS